LFDLWDKHSAWSPYDGWTWPTHSY